MAKNNLEQCAAELSAKSSVLVDKTMRTMYERDPKLEERYGPAGKQRCREDVDFHICTLIESIAAGDPTMFLRYIEWGKIVLVTRKVRTDDLVRCLLLMQDVFEHSLTPSSAKCVNGYVQAAIEKFDSLRDSVQTYIDPCSPMANAANMYLQALLSVDRNEARKIVRSLRQGGSRVQDIYRYVFEPVQREVGRLWQINHISVAQEHYCTASTELIMGELQRDLEQSDRKPHFFLGTCVAGAQHSIGVRMLSELLEANGWKVYFTGANTPTASLIDLIERFKIDVLGISAATTMDLPQVRRLIEAVRKSGRSKTRIMVGGRVFNEFPKLWKKIGADSWAKDAISGARMAQKLVLGRKKQAVKGKVSKTRRVLKSA